MKSKHLILQNKESRILPFPPQFLNLVSYLCYGYGFLKCGKYLKLFPNGRLSIDEFFPWNPPPELEIGSKKIIIPLVFFGALTDFTNLSIVKNENWYKNNRNVKRVFFNRLLERNKNRIIFSLLRQEKISFLELMKIKKQLEKPQS